MKRHHPNVFGCAIGFGCIGSGLGACAGGVIGNKLLKIYPPEKLEQLSDFSKFYHGVYEGLFGGVMIGVFIGIAYAYLMRFLSNKPNK